MVLFSSLCNEDNLRFVIKFFKYNLFVFIFVKFNAFIFIFLLSFLFSIFLFILFKLALLKNSSYILVFNTLLFSSFIKLTKLFLFFLSVLSNVLLNEDNSLLFFIFLSLVCFNGLLLISVLFIFLSSFDILIICSSLVVTFVLLSLLFNLLSFIFSFDLLLSLLSLLFSILSSSPKLFIFFPK